MEEDLLVVNESKFVALAKKLSVELNYEISPMDIHNALFSLWGDKRDLLWIPELYDLDIDFSEALSDLRKFDFEMFKAGLVSDSEIIKDFLLYEKKILIKASGAIWQIHQNDSDPFPSNPHAHQIGQNIKLDLSNGNCYRKRKLLGRIDKKELLKIREQAKVRFKSRVKLPTLAI